MSHPIQWSVSRTPIRELYEALGVSADESLSVSYLSDADGEWNTRHIAAEHADLFAQNLPDGNNVYVMVNEVTGVTLGKGQRGHEKQVTRARAVWADLDFKDSGLKTLEAAMGVIDLLSDMLGVRPAAIVFSGYGIQPYWPVDEEDGGITDNNRKYMVGLYERWGKLVKQVASIEGGKADSVFDLPRVLRAPGTHNWKVPGSPIPTKLFLDPENTPLSLAQIEEVLEAYGFTPGTEQDDDLLVLSAPESWVPAEHDCKWMALFLEEIMQSNPAARHPWLVSKYVRLNAAARNGCCTEETYTELSKTINAKFEQIIRTSNQPRKITKNEFAGASMWARAKVASMTEDQVQNNIGYHTHVGLQMVGGLGKGSEPDARISTDAVVTTSGNLALAPGLGSEIELKHPDFERTDTANAARLAKIILDTYMHVPGIGWHVWEEGVWVKDDARTVIQQAIKSVQMWAKTRSTEADLKWAVKSLSRSALESAVGIAATRPDINVRAAELDSEPYELSTPDGIIDLISGTVRTAVPSRDRHTKKTSVTPADVPAPRWEAFLKEILVDDEPIAYMQELLGVALTGKVTYQALPMFVGIGKNGKSTLLEILFQLLGDYIIAMNEGLLIRGRGEHATELARLRGARVVVGSEIPPDAIFNEQRVKELTGSDTITGRFMGQDYFSFPPSHTFLLAMNHLPGVSAGGESMWRRIKKIDFNTVIPEERQNPNLVEELIEEEGPGILWWMMQGARRVIAQGGKPIEPESVIESSKKYRDDEDSLGQFVNAKIVFADGHPGVSPNELYFAYKTFMDASGGDKLRRPSLMRELSQRFDGKFKKETGKDGQPVYPNMYINER